MLYFNHNIDTQSVQGTIISLSLIILAKIFSAFAIMTFLQGMAYGLSILVAIDTLTGGYIRRFIMRVLKIRKYENKPEGSGPDKKV